MRAAIAALLVACSSSRNAEPPRVASGDSPVAPASIPDAAPPAPHALPASAMWEPLAGRFLATRVHGDDRPCAVSRDGLVACWGALGGRGANRLETGTPHRLRDVTDVIDVVSLNDAVCVLRANGAGACLPARDGSVLPATFGAAEIAARAQDLCVRTADGRVGCYVNDYSGKPAKLVLAAGISGATSLTCMANGCCATTATTAQCMDDEAPDGKPMAGAPAGGTRIAYNGRGACALVGKGARCWGDAAAQTRAAASDVGFFGHSVCVLEGAKLHCADRTIDNVARARHDCVVHPDGGVSCLGTNWYGELGDGYPAFVTTPQPVPDLDDVVDLRVTNAQVCAVRRDRSLVCWGWAPRAQLGKVAGALGGGDSPACWIAAGKLHCHDVDPSPVSSWRPVRVAPLGLKQTPAVWAIRGDTICIAAGTKLRCHARVFEPYDDDRWIDIASGRVAEIDDFDRGFAVRFTDGRVGYFEVDDTELTDTKLKLFDTRDATKLASGNFEICVQRRSGDVTCWTTQSHAEPELVPGFRGATAIAAHAYHRCAIVGGEVVCSGRNDHGQLGRGTVHEALADQPVERVKLPAKPLKLGVAEDATCALLETGQVWCWGTDENGVLGRGRLRARATLGKVVGLGP